MNKIWQTQKTWFSGELGNPIRVVLVDDHEMVRESLGMFLRLWQDIKIVGEGANGEEALEFCTREAPDVVVIDLIMPVVDGPTAIQAIREKQPEIRFLAITSFIDQKLIARALAAGASAVMLKNFTVEGLAEAIRAVHNGHPPQADKIPSSGWFSEKLSLASGSVD